MPQLCQEHWDCVRSEVDNGIAANLFVMQEQLDRHGPKNGDYCPICHYDDGEDMMEKAIEAVKDVVEGQQ